MKATQKLYDAGQSLWLDNITRDLLTSDTLKCYIDELSITGLTSNPTIFDHAIKNSSAYDVAIRERMKAGKSGEGLFFEIALQDLTQAADLFRPIHERTSAVDGWVSLEVSPLLAYDTKSTLAAAQDLAAAEAYMRGIERRIAAGLNPNVGSVASLFVSRWDVAVAGKAPAPLTNTLGIAIGRGAYKAYCGLLASPRWWRAFNAGARPQRLLFASTGTKDPNASDILYVKGLAAPLTVNTMPENTLKAFAGHGELGPLIASDGG